jgi:hypothetical protein
MRRPYRSDSLTDSGTANCPLPHSPSMHSGGWKVTSSARPSPTSSPVCPSSFRMRDCICEGTALSRALALLGPDHRLRSTTNSGRSAVFACSVGPWERHEPERGEQHREHGASLRAAGGPAPPVPRPVHPGKNTCVDPASRDPPACEPERAACHRSPAQESRPRDVATSWPASVSDVFLYELNHVHTFCRSTFRGSEQRGRGTVRRRVRTRFRGTRTVTASPTNLSLLVSVPDIFV